MKPPSPSEPDRPRLVRLNKLLAERGVASRRACDELIASGQVIVDGYPVTELGTKVDPERQTVEVAGRVFKPERSVTRRYYLLNKPAGVVCTNEEREQRPRAVDMITERDKGRIYTVGRLDEDSKGLILLTNDGEFAQRIMHPRYEVPKTYLVKLRGHVDDEALEKIRAGVHLAEGRTAGARVVVRRRTRETSHLLVTIHEGMNREVRRVFARFGYKVVDLRRVRIGPLTDRGLKEGQWRRLTRAEVDALLACSEGRGSPAQPAGKAARTKRRKRARGRRSAESDASPGKARRRNKR